MAVDKEVFGKTPDSREVDIYTLSNKNGMKVKITNYGGTITSIMVPDRNGKMADIVLGCDDLDGTIEKESIQAAAGAASSHGMNLDDFTALIKNSGFQPIERDSLYHELKAY